MIKILRFLLALKSTVIESCRIEGDAIFVEVRPYRSKMHRCPRCNRKCTVYDHARTPRRWRALDLGAMRCFLEFRMERVSCPDHGVIACMVPWARHGSWFTKEFEEEVAWTTIHCPRTAVCELFRIDWKSVGPICKRVAEELEAAKGGSRYDGLVRIGIDETSYRKGHKYMTVVVDHDRNRIVWAAKGHGKSQLQSFFSCLSEEQRSTIKVVTADGARWIADVVDECCPNVERVMDPFHVVGWATDALDELRRTAWRDAAAKAKNAPKRTRGRPRKGEQVNPDKAAAKTIKNSRFPLLKNPEDLTEGQRCALESIARHDKRLYRGYLLKEGLRDIYKAKDAQEAKERLERWLSWACRSRIPEFVELSRKVRRRKTEIVRAVELGISNARIEAINNKIKLTVRMGYGFRNIDNLIALVMLRCSDLKPQLPYRAAA